ncbi:hypothetical protein TrVFT333_011273 [Trichoderma virens FT-333]|nr:hypothetical protein TrVFT333_011273 [Trichoderma virens FT-333]
MRIFNKIKELKARYDDWRIRRCWEKYLEIKDWISQQVEEEERKERYEAERLAAKKRRRAARRAEKAKRKAERGEPTWKKYIPYFPKPIGFTPLWELDEMIRTGSSSDVWAAEGGFWTESLAWAFWSVD